MLHSIVARRRTPRRHENGALPHDVGARAVAQRDFNRF
jgi:hypothetical protein